MAVHEAHAHDNHAEHVAQRHAVRILFVSGDRVAVQTSASEAALTRVITRGAQYLTNDTPIRIVTSEGVEVKQPELSQEQRSPKTATVAKVRP